MRVLVADDDKALSQLLCATLIAGGHQPIPVFDGASTMMQAIRQPAPDLIVLDLQMPAGDGQATLLKLKQSSRTMMIPIVVLTATRDEKVRDSVRLAGAATYVEKPITPERFLEVVESFARPKP